MSFTASFVGFFIFNANRQGVVNVAVDRQVARDRTQASSVIAVKFGESVKTSGAIPVYIRGRGGTTRRAVAKAKNTRFGHKGQHRLSASRGKSHLIGEEESRWFLIRCFSSLVRYDNRYLHPPRSLAHSRFSRCNFR